MAKIIIASPLLPCGTTWLLNCLLELNLKVYRSQSSHNLWNPGPRGLQLHPAEHDLRRHLPALTRREHFRFDSNTEFEWTHEFPLKRFQGCKVIFFIRDPRDAFYSWYRRAGAQMSYQDFVHSLDCFSLLDRVTAWNFYQQTWFSDPARQIQFFRFEDYKRDPQGLLERILAFCGLTFSSDDIAQAISESTFEKAQAAEAAYQQLHPQSQYPTVNRAGRPGEWKTLPEEIQVVSQALGLQCQDWLSHYGYQPPSNDRPAFPAVTTGYCRKVAYFDAVALPPPLEQESWENELTLQQVEKLCRSLSQISLSHLLACENFQRLYAWKLGLTLWRFQKRAQPCLPGTGPASRSALKTATAGYCRLFLRSQLQRLLQADWRYFGQFLKIGQEVLQRRGLR